jgi:hypothetical protein
MQEVTSITIDHIMQVAATFLVQRHTNFALLGIRQKLTQCTAINTGTGQLIRLVPGLPAMS